MDTAPAIDVPAIEQTLVQAFARQVRRHGDRAAIVTESATCTYAELDRLSNRIAHGLAASGLAQGSTVGVLFEQGAAQIAAILGVLKAGGIYVPLDAALGRHRLRDIVADAQPACIVADRVNRSLAALVGGERLPLLGIDDVLDRHPDTPAAWCGTPDAPACIYYTSGTTGGPKGVVDNHRNVLHNVARYTTSLAIDSADRLTLLQSCGFSGAVSNIFGALLNGAVLLPFDVRARGTSALATWLASQRATIYHSVPALFRRVAESGVPLHSLRIVRLEGDAARPIDVDVFNRCFGTRCTLVNGLGATETGIAAQCFIAHGTQFDSGVVPVGWPTADMRLDVLDSRGRPVPRGEIGEIVVSSRYLACGYWRRPELTAASFSTAASGVRSYRTRDLGRFDAQGRLEMHGRADQLAKVRGEWVDLSRLERALAQCAGVRDAIAGVGPGASGDAVLTAWLLTDAGQRPDAERLRDALREHGLPEQALPHRCIEVDRWPMDRNGKIDRRALAAGGDAVVPSTTPRTRTERIVADVFARQLGLACVAADDDFFALGGDSLKAVEACLELARRTGSDLALGAFQHAATVSALARVLDGQAGTAQLVALQPSGSEAPLFCVHAHMGHVFNLRELALQFAPDRPFFGLQAQGLDGAEPPETRLEAMAQAYVARLREAQPQGPYRVAGYCFGAWIAVEMARRLRQGGDGVAALLLIDPNLPPSFRSSAPHSGASVAARLRRATLRSLGRALRRRAAGAVAALKTHARGLAAHRLEADHWLRRRLLRRPADAMEQMSRHYRPLPCEVDAVVLVAADKDLDDEQVKAWRRYLGGAVEFERLAGPGRDLLRQPYVRDVAACLLRRLERRVDSGPGR